MAKKSAKLETLNNIKEDTTMNNYATTNYQSGAIVPMNTNYELPSSMGQVYYDSGRLTNPTLYLSMSLNVTELLQVQAQSMFEAYNLGARSVSCNIPQQNNAEMFGVDVYLGIYDDEAYGVYNNAEKYNKSETYWRSSQVRQTFLTYEEALEFARNGVASLNNMDVKDVPPLKIACNWRQKITET